MSKFPSQELDRFNVRLPTGMRDAVAERAKRNGRSMNSEIVDIITNALSQPALAQEGIDFILGLTEPEVFEKLKKEDKAKVRSALPGAAAILARKIEEESTDLRKIIFLLSQDAL